MAVVAGTGIGTGSAEVDFTVNASNVVTGITIRTTLPGPIRVLIRHAGSGYSLVDPINAELGREFVVGAAPLTVNLATARRFPNDNSALVTISPDGRTVTG